VSARILDGKAQARAVVDELRAEVAATSASRPPALAARCGIRSQLEQLPAGASETEVAAVLDGLNAEPQVDGILLQLPLPAGVDSQALLRRLDPAKDVDGLHPVNLGKLVADDPSGFLPCTPSGIVELLRRSEIDIEGRRVTVLGRSNLVGKPLALLLLRRARVGNATVTVLHTRSRDVPERVREAEIVVAAAGSPLFVQAEWLRPGATVVDVGIHRLPGNESGRARLVGDVDFARALEVVGAITPVPGGVGPMTVAMLMKNTVLAWSRSVQA
jgi:methylenetetrahydrofolate dehydrogenase (NADP+)/methenyltetrahydrofolate cyclohydrolase